MKDNNLKIKIRQEQKADYKITENLITEAFKPAFQKQGIGELLINEGHKLAKEYGYSSVILLGYPEYYTRFGYKPASQFNIKAPFAVPYEVFMAIELAPDGLSGISGIVKYPNEFDGV